MNDYDYLNQISAKPQQPSSNSFFSNPMFKILVGVICIIFLSVIGLVLVTVMTPKETTAASELTRVYQHTFYLDQTVSTYSPRLKSSSLRASSSSLKSILAELNSNSHNTLTTTYALPENVINAISPEDKALIDDSNATLERARLNGVLDRYYASQIAYRIHNLIIYEDIVLTKTTDPSITSYIDSSKASLSQLEETFSSFSETK